MKISSASQQSDAYSPDWRASSEVLMLPPLVFESQSQKALVIPNVATTTSPAFGLHVGRPRIVLRRKRRQNPLHQPRFSKAEVRYFGIISYSCIANCIQSHGVLE